MAETKANLLKYSPKVLLEMGVKFERQEEIPVSQIVKESALIDPTHAENLAESMMGERKQISPTTVRARIDELTGKVVYDVIDGFHRSEGKRIIEEKTKEPQTMKTIVLYGCSDEELFDLRVLAASSVKSIKFARMAEWMKSSFMSTEWQNPKLQEMVKNENITLSQVFTLTQFNTSGKNLKLNQSEVEELKTWALKKSKQWGKPISVLMTEMRTVEVAAPDLVQKVRIGGGGGKDGRGVLTKARLEAIVLHLPGDWENQRKLVDLAIAKNILADDLDFLSWTLSNAKLISDDKTIEIILNHPELLLNPEASTNLKDEEVASVEKQLHALPTIVEYKAQKVKRKSRSSNKHVANNSNQLQKEIRIIESPSDKEILYKYNVIQIIKAMIDKSLEEKPNQMNILELKNGSLTLNRENNVLKFINKEIQLTSLESRILITFSHIEGVVVPRKLLSLILNEYEVKNIKETVVNLKSKMEKISPLVSELLAINDDDTYSWLQE